MRVAGREVTRDAVPIRLLDNKSSGDDSRSAALLAGGLVLVIVVALAFVFGGRRQPSD